MLTLREELYKYLYSISAQNDYVCCPVDHGSIQGSHWPISLTREYILNTRERLIIKNRKFQYKWDIDETYYAACKVEYLVSTM